MTIDASRVYGRIQEIARYGSTEEGGVTRLAFSSAERRARERIVGWMRDLGLAIRYDSAGNVFGRRGGQRDLPAVLLGSHIDSVPSGGAFDGVAGVIAALEVLQYLSESSITTSAPVEIVVFANEEGSRFRGGLMGSQAFTGLLDDGLLDEIADRDGTTLRAAMQECGISEPSLERAAVADGEYAAFFELHIEQSVALEAADCAVGVVTGIAGPHQMWAEIRGRSGHAGATPMTLRRDPMVAAAIVIQEVETSVAQSASTRATVGDVRVVPGAHNVIADTVGFSIDIRGVDLAEREAVFERIRSKLESVCASRKLSFSLRETQRTDPVELDPSLTQELLTIGDEIGVRTVAVFSGAAHDAMVVSRRIPTGMVFVRSAHGHSHCPEEYSSPEDLAAATEVLLHAVVRRAN